MLGKVGNAITEIFREWDRDKKVIDILVVPFEVVISVVRDQFLARTDVFQGDVSSIKY